MIAANIPQERIPVLIGKNGKTKEFIEKKTSTKIFIGQEVEVTGDTENELKCSEIIKAVGRGFHPNAALSLLREDFVLDIINVKGTQNTIKRLLARIIGSQGKARKNIEKLTGASIAVYGKTVSMIGNYKEVSEARKAVEMLILGRKHAHVWSYFEK